MTQRSTYFLLCVIPFFISVILLGCTSGSNSEAVDAHIHSDSSVHVTPEMATIDGIMSVSWVGIKKREAGWTIVSFCNSPAPMAKFHGDTLEMYKEDGAHDMYKVRSAAFGEKSGWNFQVMPIPQDSLQAVQALTVYVMMFDHDKTHWQIGNDRQLDFVDAAFIREYPITVVECDDAATQDN